MDTQSEKYHLIQQIIELQDSTLVKKLRDLLSKETKNDDWYHSLSNVEKEAISEGIQDLENGNVVSHQLVMISVKNKISDLMKS